MNYNKTYKLKKATSDVGLLTFTSFAVMVFMQTVYISLNSSMHFSGSDANLLFNSITSLCSMFIIGLIFSSATEVKLNTLVPMKRVKRGYFIPLVLIATAVSMMSNYITEIFVNNLSAIGIHNKASMDYGSSGATPLTTALTILSVAIIPPLTEEFLFRGLILNRLKPFGINYAIFTSSLLFGLMHGNIVQVPFAFIVGLVFALVTVKSGSILPSMAAHFLVNFSSIAVDLSSNGPIDENTLTIIYLVFVLVIMIGGIFSAALLSKKKKFFKIYASNEYEFKESIKAGYSSVGMIMSFIAFLLEIIISVEIWGISII